MQPEARCFAIASIAGQLGLAFPRSVFLPFLPSPPRLAADHARHGLLLLLQTLDLDSSRTDHNSRLLPAGSRSFCECARRQHCAPGDPSLAPRRNVSGQLGRCLRRRMSMRAVFESS